MKKERYKLYSIKHLMTVSDKQNSAYKLIIYRHCILKNAINKNRYITT